MMTKQLFHYIALMSVGFILGITIIDTQCLAQNWQNRLVAGSQANDFLIDSDAYTTRLEINRELFQIELTNGLISRQWRIEPNLACTSFKNLTNGQEMLRAVRPEANLTIDQVNFEVGGLSGQPNLAFLKTEWLDKMQSDPDSLQFVDYEIGEPAPRLKWKRRRHHAPNSKWPPAGKHLKLHFQLPAGRGNVEPGLTKITVHYEMYDGIPAISKWISVSNTSSDPITIDRFRVEELAAVEHTNWVETRDGSTYPQPDYLHVETDFAFGGFTHQNANRHCVSWQTDPQYKTQVNYLLQTPCLLVVEPTYGPAQEIKAGETFESFRVFELAYDSSDRERRGLTLRKMYRTLAPWVTENPITHHLLSSDPQTVKNAIDNAAEVGFEAIILSFGSGFNMENTDPGYIQTWKEVADHAESKNIEIGAYSLFSSRSVGGGNDVVSPKGQRPKFGRAPAATSEWGINYFRTLADFFDQTGFDQFENDGPYPGDVDILARPPYQKGIDDSRWAQWKIVTGLYKHLRETGVYINQPDYYFMNGGNKTGMGYRETNWSLPRAQQIIHTRQNIFDGTWTKTPSMGWMHVPLSQYHGGGAAATIEPLSEHLDHYQRIMRCNFGMGVQAHYRGPRLFDTEQTKQTVKSTVDWFKQYRDILESDIIHGRRADGRDLDWVLHVNPKLENKGMLCVYNPTDEPVKKTLQVDLYYTGLTNRAVITGANDETRGFELNRDYSIEIEVNVPANGMNWYIIR